MKVHMMLLLLVLLSLNHQGAEAKPESKRNPITTNRIISLILAIAAATSADPAQLDQYRELDQVDLLREELDQVNLRRDLVDIDEAPEAESLIAPAAAACVPAIPNPLLTKRKLVSALSTGEWLGFREAVRKGQLDGIASVMNQVNNDHGHPNYYCPHGSFKFLPWHRYNLRRMEKALGGISLPYWDWTAQSWPPQYNTATYRRPSCASAPNPLRTGTTANGGPTTRGTSSVGTAQLKAQVLTALASTTFEAFSQNLEFAHNSVHGQIGGSMGQVSDAAFDPIFWAHHNFVDNVWYQWQLKNRNAAYPAEAKGPLTDSTGTFTGLSQINALGDWQRPGRLLRSMESMADGLGNEVMAYVDNIPPCNKRCKVELVINNVVVGTTYQPGMGSRMGNIRYSGAILCTEGYAKLVKDAPRMVATSFQEVAKSVVVRVTEIGTEGAAELTSAVAPSAIMKDVKVVMAKKQF